MKKLLLLTACALTIGLTSCSKDDDGGSSESFECAGFTFTKGENGNAFDEEGNDTGIDFEEAKNNPACKFF